jgi:hypothetical protein
MPNLTGRAPTPKPDKLSPAEVLEGRLRMAVLHWCACVVCGQPGPSIVHHCISDRYGSARAPDMMTIPLCSPHHDYWQPEGIHAGKERWEAKHGPDHGYLGKADAMIAALSA